MPRKIPRDLFAGVGIVGVTGVNGAGKTTLAVQSAIIRMIDGQTVYSTVAIRYVDDSGRVYESLPLRSIRQLLELSNCTVLLDDVAVIFSARSTQSLPPEVVAFLDTCRHRKVSIIWTAPTWMRCDNLLRGVTQAVGNVIPVRAFSEANGSPWPRPRLILAGLMDTSDGKIDAAPTKVLRRRVFRQKGLLSFGAYDTYADTPLLGRHLQSGVCVDCGGSQPREKHSAERHAAMGLPWFEDDQRAFVVEELLPVTFAETQNPPA